MGLKLTLLGPFQASRDGVPLRSLVASLPRALLAYLAVEADVPHPRGLLAALLWPEQPDAEALARLRHTLSDLRRALGEADRQQPFLLTSRETIWVNPAAGLDLDVTAFAGAIHSTPAPDALLPDGEALGRLQQAAALYRGGFLEGLSVRSAPFEEWTLLRREQFHWQAMGALRLLAAAHEARGEYSQAERYARRELELQPWQEEAHRQLMRALVLGGQRSAALAQYQICIERLSTELGVAPADETVALYEAIRDGGLTDSEARRQLVTADPSSGRSAATTPSDRAGNQVRLARLASLPFHPLTSPVFVGREPELAKLERFLEMALSGQGRVALVSGEAGSGKTALMGQFSRRAMARHRDLVAAGGNCNAHAGSGDPYLPFREILQLLSGEVEAHRAGGSLSPEHARRLWALLPYTAQALGTLGPDLVGTFVPGEPLLLRTQAFAPDVTGRDRLEALVRRPPGHGSPPSQVDLFGQVTHVLQAVAAEYPLILILDDLQWADSGTVGLLFHLGRRLRESRILVVAAYRPATVALGRPLREKGGRSGRERQAEPWERHPLALIIHEFGRDWGDIQVDLGQADGRAFVEAFLDTEPNRLGVAFRETLCRHTGGNPLFTIELLHGLQERGDLLRDETGRWVEGPVLHWQQLPARVEAVIAERFDRLSAECQTLLQVAGAEGEEFTAEVLARVANLDLPEVIHCLSETLGKRQRLVRAAHLLRLDPDGPYLSRYRFAHSLFQRYIYDHLDEVARTHLHRSIAEALEALCPARASGAAAGVQDPTAPVRLAWHWEAAGQFGRAATYLLQAGKQAAQLSAHEEAVHLFRRGLGLLEQLPDTAERAQLEMQFLMSLVGPLMPIQGWGSAERAQLTQRALDLEQQRPTSEGDLIGALYLRAEMLRVHGKAAESMRLVEALLHLAHRSETPAYIALGHYSLAWNRFFSGDMAGSIPDFQRALALYDRGQHAFLQPLTGGDLGVGCQSLLAMALWYVGLPEQGLSCSQQAIAQAQQMAHPLTEALALAFAGCSAHAVAGRIQAVQEYARRLIELSEQKRLPTFRPYGLIFQGWAEALSGTGRQAVAQIRDGLAEWRAMGHRAGTPFLMLVLAQALQHTGALDEALSATEEGLALADEISPAVRAEFFRMKGELLNHCPAPANGGRPPATTEDPPLALEQAEAYFRMAVAEARQSGARFLELRATVSLARLWVAEDKRAEARQALADIYGWFTEGFETPDLRAAKALLDTLGDQSRTEHSLLGTLYPPMSPGLRS